MKFNFDFSIGNKLKDFFFFDKLFTPVFITFIYWLGLLLLSISGLLTIFGGFAAFQYSFLGGLKIIFYGLLIVVIGSIYLRITMELICVLFNINRNIEKLALKSTNVEESD